MESGLDWTGGGSCSEARHLVETSEGDMSDSHDPQGGADEDRTGGRTRLNRRLLGTPQMTKG